MYCVIKLSVLTMGVTTRPIRSALAQAALIEKNGAYDSAHMVTIRKSAQFILLSRYGGVGPALP
jgi:hypothetical protein